MTTVAANPTMREMRDPTTMSDSTERPKLSVPSSQCTVGGWNGFPVAKATLTSFAGTKNGPTTASRMNRIIITRPTIPMRLRR